MHAEEPNNFQTLYDTYKRWSTPNEKATQLSGFFYAQFSDDRKFPTPNQSSLSVRVFQTEGMKCIENRLGIFNLRCPTLNLQ
jgi:hypothetical protein